MTGYEDLDRNGSWRTLPEYGAVWIPTRVAPGWAPYRDGRWVWVAPWGWTWVDNAPWGFAPFHYGRWVWVDNYWAWAPGRIVRRPVYAPALVAFIGGSHWSQSGTAVGWFPLGWREPFRPWYRASHAHVRNVNAFHGAGVANPEHVTHRYRHRPDAVTVVPRDSFVSARDIARSRVHVAHTELARAEILRDGIPAQPGRSSIAAQAADDGHRGFGPGARRERELARRSEALPARTDPLPAHTARPARPLGSGSEPQRGFAQQPAAVHPPRATAPPPTPPGAPMAATAAPLSPTAQPARSDEGHRGRGPGARRERELSARQPPPAPPPGPAAQPQRSDEGHRGHGPGARRERELSGKSPR